MILTKETMKGIDSLVRNLTGILIQQAKGGSMPIDEDLCGYCDLLTAVGNLGGQGGDNLPVVGFNAPRQEDDE